MMHNASLFFRVHAYDYDGNEVKTLNFRATSRDRAQEAMRRKAPGARVFKVIPLRSIPVVFFDA